LPINSYQSVHQRTVQHTMDLYHSFSIFLCLVLYLNPRNLTTNWPNKVIILTTRSLLFPPIKRAFLVESKSRLKFILFCHIPIMVIQLNGIASLTLYIILFYGFWNELNWSTLHNIDFHAWTSLFYHNVHWFLYIMFLSYLRGLWFHVANFDKWKIVEVHTSADWLPDWHTFLFNMSWATVRCFFIYLLYNLFCCYRPSVCWWG
jgi:hypothetical protein